MLSNKLVTGYGFSLSTALSNVLDVIGYVITGLGFCNRLSVAHSSPISRSCLKFLSPFLRLDPLVSMDKGTTELTFFTPLALVPSSLT